MLQEIFIKNYAIIEEVQITFEPNLNIVTGETGAGKSILLGALGLIAGKRADTSVLQRKDEKCIVEAHFNIANNHLKSFFELNELDYDPKNTLIRREINDKGKSRAFINDTPVSLDILKGLCENLIDIHSQHDSLLLNRPEIQLKFIDVFAGSEKEFEAYQEKYQYLKQKEHTLNELLAYNKLHNLDLDYVHFQLNEINELNPTGSEVEQLERELEIMENSEQIADALNYFSQSLFDDDRGMVYLLKNGKIKLEEVEKYIDQTLIERLKQVIIELEDLGNEVDGQMQSIDLDFNKKTEVEERLNNLNSLMHKHHLSNDDQLLELKEELEAKLQTSEERAEEITKLQNEVAILTTELTKLAEKLSEKRTKSFKVIEKEIEPIFKELNMKDASLQIHHEKVEMNTWGTDSITFLLKTNKGSAYQNLSKVASGGELSRVMLSLKKMVAEKMKLPTIIFDEIDTGVSGETANMLGNVLASMSLNNQTIVITHLPQIASKTGAHFKVSKDSTTSKTVTSVVRLNQEERIQEVAKMLSGQKISDLAIKNAKELLSTSIK